VSALEVSGLEARYGRARILFDVALDVGAGEAVALLGRNGAGKSTTLRSILGLVPHRAGKIVFGGEDISGLPTHEIVRRGLGYVPEDRRIFTDLTTEENLLVGRRPPRPGAPTWTLDQLFSIFPNLRELRGRLGARMSGGEQQMLTIARTLTGNPELLLLDEPSEGLAPLVVDTLRDKIAELKVQGLTILLAEQRVDFALALADRVYVLEKGAVRYSGAAAELREDKALVERLLSL